MSHHHKPHAVSEKMYIDMSDLRDTKRNKKLKTKDQTKHEDPTKLVIHTGIDETPTAAATDNKKDMLVIEWVDIKQTRLDILSNYRAWTPARIVQVFRKHYTNMKSLSVMLSRMKKDLKELDDPPPESYLEKIALKRSEYSELKKQAKDTRQKGALDVQIVSNADDVVLQALRYLTSSDPNLLYAALLPLTGLRPIEIAKQAQFSEKLNNTQNNAEFWACQTRFAKRGNMKSKYNHCRDRPFLAPYYLVERALNIIRQRWSCKHLTNVQVNRKFSTNWQKILVKAYPMWPGITAKMFRRFFAAVAYRYFGESSFNKGTTQSSQIGFSHWVLGHTNLDDQAIAYESLHIRPQPKLKLFQLGKGLKVPQTRSQTPSKRLR